MPTCSKCSALNGMLSSTPPHEKLVEGRKSPYKSGIGLKLAEGYMVGFSCKDCGTELIRDMDVKDREAAWYIRS